MRTIIALTATTALAALAAPAVAQTQADAVLATYADIAAAGYGDSLGAAVTLDAAIDAFRAAPSAEGLARARAARLAARVPYQQTEAFRSRNPIVDDWEGRVNAGPLDEGLIDYVVAAGTAPLEGYDENPSAAINVIANASFSLSCEPVDAAAITPAQLQDRPHEAGGPEANVATGYHAIEFLLWGQDIGPYDATAGQRPWTDYAAGDACTGGNCDRRGAYLAAASELLVADLDEMAAAWARGGAARASVAGDANGVARILTGLGSLSCGELAGERMQLGLLLNDPEEEHSCFADNTHNDHFHDALGIRNVLTGRYVGLDGTITQGPLVPDLVAQRDAGVADGLRAAVDATMARMTELKLVAEAGKAYDMMLDPANEAGGGLIRAAVDALVAQTCEIERAVAVLGVAVEIEGSDSLDAPDAVFEWGDAPPSPRGRGGQAPRHGPRRPDPRPPPARGRGGPGGPASGRPAPQRGGGRADRRRHGPAGRLRRAPGLRGQSRRRRQRPPPGRRSGLQPAAGGPALRAAARLRPRQRPVPAAAGRGPGRDGRLGRGGPMFTTRACQDCHLKDGHGHAPAHAGDDAGRLVVRLGIPRPDPAAPGRDLGVEADPVYGRQLSDGALPGLRPEGRVSVTWETVESVPLAGTGPVPLRRPVWALADLASGPLDPATRISPRVAPPRGGGRGARAAGPRRWSTRRAARPATCPPWSPRGCPTGPSIPSS
jgi:putative iron-regulated protein